MNTREDLKPNHQIAPSSAGGEAEAATALNCAARNQNVLSSRRRSRTSVRPTTRPVPDLGFCIHGNAGCVRLASTVG